MTHESVLHTKSKHYHHRRSASIVLTFLVGQLSFRFTVTPWFPWKSPRYDFLIDGTYYNSCCMYKDHCSIIIKAHVFIFLFIMLQNMSYFSVWQAVNGTSLSRWSFTHLTQPFCRRTSPAINSVFNFAETFSQESMCNYSLYYFKVIIHTYSYCPTVKCLLWPVTTTKFASTGVSVFVERFWRQVC